MRLFKGAVFRQAFKVGFLVLVLMFVGGYLYMKGYHFPSLSNKEKRVEVSSELEGIDLLVVSPDFKNQGLKEDIRFQKALYYFSIGDLVSLENKVGDAIIYFSKALEFDPDAAYLHSRLAEEYIKTSEFDRAKQHLKRTLELNPNSITGHFLLGNINAAEKDYKEAISHYEAVIRLDPEKEQAYILLATVHAERGNYAKGGGILRELLKINPQSFLAHYYLGRIYSDQEKHLLAAQHYKKALKIHATFLPAALALGLYYETKDQVNKALQVYLDVIQNGADDSRLLRRAIRLLIAHKDYRRVLKLLEDLKRQDPKDLNNRVRIGLIYFEMEHYDKARVEFEGLLKDHPESDRLHYYVSAVYERVGEIDKALLSLQKVSERSSFYHEAVRNRIMLLMEKKEYAKARGIAEKILKKFPDKNEYYDLSASLYEREGNYLKAVQILHLALKRFPTEERLLYYLGVIYDKMGDSKKSLETMQKVLKLNPNYADALNFIGYTYVIQNRKLKEAEQMVRKALTLKPGYGYIEDSLGWIYYRRGNYRQALKWLTQAAKLRPDEAIIFFHLGDTYVKMNQIEKAYQLYQQALRLNPDKKTEVLIQQKIKELSRHDIIRQRFPATGK